MRHLQPLIDAIGNLFIEYDGNKYGLSSSLPTYTSIYNFRCFVYLFASVLTYA